MGRRVLGVSRMTTREVIQGELGLQSVKSRRLLLRIKFWVKIIMMNPNRLVYKVYKQRRIDLIKKEMRDKKNWCYWTWKILKDLHLEHIWQSEKIPKVSTFLKLVRDKIKINEESEWREEMKKKSKLRTYRKLKNSLELEPYILQFDRERRRHLTMLRGGTNKLRIERGRWRGENEYERVCNVCITQEVEDEKHFILGCSMYVRERVEMFEKIKRLEKILEDIERRDEETQLDILIGRGITIRGEKQETKKKIREIVLDYIHKADKIRNRYIKDR